MSPENEKKLNERFGYLSRSHRSPRHALHMFGFECGDGWYDLLYELFEKIETHFKTQPPEVVDAFSVQQIKEKYGTLRFYCSGDDVVEGFIREAEDKSEVTCEACGKPGKIRPGGWISVQCHEHHLEAIARAIIPQVQAYSEPYDHVSRYGDNKGQIEVRIRTKEENKGDMMHRVTKELHRYIKDDVNVQSGTDTKDESSES